MNNWNKALAAILVVQVILAVIVLRPSGEEEAEGGLLLSGFDTTAIEEITITNDQDDTIRLVKNAAGNWVLPDADDFPVDNFTAEGLLQKIANLETDRLITRSETSHRRLKVSPDEFLRKIDLKGDGIEHTLYLGTTGGGNATHARLDDQEQVYLVSNLSVQDATTVYSSWIDELYFSATADQITSLKLQNANGEFEFVKEGEEWTLVGKSAEEIFNTSAFETMLNQAVALRMFKPLGKEDKEEYGLDEPQATLIITVREPVPTPTPTPQPTTETTAEATAEATEAPTEAAEPTQTPTPSPTPEPQFTEQTYTIIFGPEYEDNVVVKSSGSEYYVIVTEGNARTFIDKRRESFVSLPTPEPTATFTPTPEATATPEAIPTEGVTPEAASTEEVTPKATEEATPASN